MMPQDFPLQRRARRIIWIALVPGAACIFLRYWPWHPLSEWNLAVGGMGIALIWTALIAWVWQTARTAADAHDHRFVICPSCRYDLHGVPEAGECPECGRPYTRDELERTWKAEMGMPHHDPQDELRMILDSSVRPEDDRKP